MVLNGNARRDYARPALNCSKLGRNIPAISAACAVFACSNQGPVPISARAGRPPEETMTSRDRAAGSKSRSQGSGKTASAAKGIAATKKLAPVKQSAAKKVVTLKKISSPIKKVEAKKPVP